MAGWMHRSHQRGNQIGFKTALSLMGCHEEGDDPPSTLSQCLSDIQWLELEPADKNSKSDPCTESSPPKTELEKAIYDQLKEEGNSYFQQGKYSEALNKYFQTLNFYYWHDMKEQMALIQAKCTLACLKLQIYSDAYTHSMEWVKLDPENDEAYMCRAEIQKKILHLQSKAPPNITYKNVVADYCRAHELKTSTTAIVEAIIVAIDKGHSDMVRHIREMPLDFCNKVFIEILSRYECRQTHLEFLVTGMWNEKKIDISTVNLKQLILEKRITSASLLQHFLELGLPLDNDDIKMSMNCLQYNQLQLFKVIAAKSNPLYLVELYHVATTCTSTNRMTFMLIIAELGADVPVHPNHVEELLICALNIDGYCRALSLTRQFTRTLLEKVDLASLMKTDIVNYPKLIEALLDGGVNPNRSGDGTTPIAMVMDRFANWSKKIELICLLLDKGEHCSHLSSKSCTPPLHVATEVALKSGDLRLINSVICSSSFNQHKVTNDKGESPLHLAIKSHWKRELSTIVFSALLGTGVLDPSQRDKSRRRPLDYLREPDERITILKDTIFNLNPDKRSIQESKRSKVGSVDTIEMTRNQKKQVKSPQLNSAMKVDNKQNLMGEKLELNQAEINVTKKLEDNSEQSRSQESSKQVSKSSAPKKERTYNIQLKDEYKVLCSNLDKHMKRLMSKKVQYFRAEIIEEVATSHDDETTKKQELVPGPLKVEEERSSKDTVKENKVGKKQDKPLEDMTGILAEYIDGLDFDKLSWEVEVTAKVIKFFKDRKKIPFDVQGAAAKTIYQLATGKRNEHLSKLVSCKKSIQLYEARMTKAARILWEKAKSHSSRLTETAHSTTPIYTDVIRVWEIVLDHDHLNERIKHCTEQIEKSHLCEFRLSLLPQKAAEPMEKVRGRQKSDIPMTYLLQTGSEKMKSEYQFTPAVNAKDNKYSLTFLYSFDTITAKSMLFGTNDRRDFPFKEWHKEHEIIQLPYTEAILLLGRSGTGKTTCCLYRLWNQFKNFWNLSSTPFGWKNPQRQLTPSAVVNDDAATQTEIDNEDGAALSLSVEDNVAGLDNNSNDSSNSAGQEISSSVSEVGEDTEMVEEDLHQVFITKNYVLCDQMKRRFYNMAAAYDFHDHHVQFETTSIATDLSNMDSGAFPLFLTARQFYILLDNSLSDGHTFFKRDKEGNLMVKIVSLDYDQEDPDILLDIEQSDSEDEEEDVLVSTTTQLASKEHTERWTEVTALYFKESIWPSISHQCGISSKDSVDPLLVWIEIQSFIKGSESALRKGTPLNLEEYKEIGNRMAPNFSSHRDTIYKVFIKYQNYQQNQRHHNFLFDECDLVLHLYNRLKKVQDVPWSIHSLYIDEVQDFTQAELAVFIHCCRNPNSMFFTGDTAQSIMRGIAFRFQDLRSIFHKLHSQNPVVNVPQKPHNLTINFRSHSGILNLAGSIIDLISEFFKDSIDHLPDDEGMFPGPTPVLLKSSKTGDLALLLTENKEEYSTIDFGAHQVILVQSREAKDKLPSILRNAIVLTIFEAKGLEFDDVLLYNFFTDSIVDEKCWRVISSYLEMPRHCEKVVKPLPSGPRSQQFDPKLHKSLNSELKYLYTAITRAKCHLWIYDSDCELRRPMFDYWQRRNLIMSQPVQFQPSMENQPRNILAFASESTSEQWKVQGDSFMKKHLWEQAVHCYVRASPNNEYLYLTKEAHARYLIQQARHHKPQLYLEAALRFLEGDKLHHNLHYLYCAALCLKSSNPPKYLEAAKLFEHLGRSEKAVQSYLKGKDIENYARLKESMGQHEKVIRTLMSRTHKRDALIKASEYEKKGIVLSKDLSASELSYSLANFYAKMGDKKTLIDVLTFMPEVDRKTKFLKEAGFHNEAFEILAKHQKLKDAYRLASAQGGCKQSPSDYIKAKTWLKKGIELAGKSKDENMRASFVFQMAKMEYVMRQTNKDEHDVDRIVVDNLHALFQSKDQLIQAQALLLFGIINKEWSFCRKAHHIYHKLRHVIGELEAFNQTMLLSNKDCRLGDQLLLNVCHKAKEASDALRKASDMNKIVKEGLSFYGLQKIGDYCYTTASQEIWTKGQLVQPKCKTSEYYDPDGMLKLKVSDVRSELAKHCQQFKDSWVSYSELKLKLERKQMRFSLHQLLWKKPHHLQREYSMVEVSAEALRDYLQTLIHLLELYSLREERTDELISLLISIFGPEVYIYLPERVTNAHITITRRSVYSHCKFQLFIKHTSFIKDSLDQFDVESWLRAWRASCISQPDMKLLFSILQDLENKVNSKLCVRGERPREIPPGFIFWKNDKKLRHIFSLWLNSCVEIREKGRFLWASKLAIYRFVGTIAKSFNQYHIRVMSIVDILSVYCTGLLHMLTHINFMQNVQRSFIIPHLYQNSVQLFNLMISWREEDHSIFSACAKEAHSLENKTECYQVLIGALEHLVGTSPYIRHFSLLGFSLRLEKIVSTDAAKQCLILALVLFGNLSMFYDQQTVDFDQKMNQFYQEILFLLQHARSIYGENTPDYISMAYHTIINPNFPHSPADVFTLVERLLHDAKVNSTLAWLTKHPRTSKVEIKPIHSSTQREALLPQTSAPVKSFVPPPPGFTSGLQGNTELAGSLQNSSSSEHYPQVAQEMQYSNAEWEQAQMHSKQEEVDMALTCGAMGQWLQVNPELIDPEIVTHTFCNVCGMYLKADHIFSGIEEVGLETDDAILKEPYDIHVFSVSHESNILLYRQLTAILSNESGTEMYPILRQELINLLHDCQQLQSKYGTDKLTRLIDDIEEELERNEKVLAELQETCSWREAIKTTTTMVESMDRLMMRGKEVYCQVSEHVKHRFDAEFEGKEEDSEDDAVDMPENIERELDFFSEQYEQTEKQSSVWKKRGEVQRHKSRKK